MAIRYPRYIQEMINRLIEEERRYLQEEPTRFFVRHSVPEERDAHTLKALIASEKRHENICEGCNSYVIVICSPDKQDILHFFTNREIASFEEIDAVVQGLSLLVRSETQEDWERVKKLVLTGNDAQTPVTYQRVAL